ncbi:hypothetical protein A1O1_07419 [Capronia coronata CBS 617.96]|uniref:Extracellular membrane protein CFEM domain-containing protein n=1 Tax=Capronia coronata CBS 617.96 TaxID=1182541 RepID=W9XTB1_9EURO|nr:uncharacterized protein A1O1_07419 [Capronia coronata CBS 617.96]EXJ83792.1 hypothetical protein A1O1_07419 [Capronia coronata CBS 617.96]
MRTSLVAVAAFGVATASATFVYPENVPLHRRQAPGTPQYDCHANCGGVIVDGRTEGYCDTADFTTKLDACLDCALVYDIWQYYGNSVSSAAEECGVDATPRAAATTDSAVSTSAPAVETSSAAAPATSTAAATEVAATTTAATSSVEETGSETSSAAPTVATFEGAGTKLVLTGLLAIVPFAAMAAGLA